MKIGVYPGTFDPVTNGHLDIIKRSLKIFDKVIVVVASNPRKTPLFSLDERVEMIKEFINSNENIGVETLDSLLVNYIKKKKAIAIIRGLRAVSDFEYEFQMALMNRNLDQSIETIFLVPSEEYSYLSSSIVKEVAMLGGNVEKLVPPLVLKRLKEKSIREDII